MRRLRRMLTARRGADQAAGGEVAKPCERGASE